jgi:alpha-N-acetylglucosamine transferase
MAFDSEEDFLPSKDLIYFKAYPSIVIRYLPKPARAPSFYKIQFYKFHILKFTRYRRVLYLGADVMPLCSLDYLFVLSENGTFKENMALAGNNEPADGSFMMLRPGIEEYQQLLSVVESRDANILASSQNLTFDKLAGWGHVIQSPDRWRTRYSIKSGTKWNFPSAFSDQGLLYHWIKYVKKNATLFIGNEVENWSAAAEKPSPVLEATLVDSLKGYECPLRLEFPHDRHTKPPYDMEGQVWHFWGEKPWMMQNVDSIIRDDTNAFRAYKLWFQAFDQMKNKLGVNAGSDMLKELKRNPLPGQWLTEIDMKQSLARKHAYAFLVAGVDPRRPRGYRGLLFSIMVNAHTLETSGSQADIVILIQMHFSTRATALPKFDLDNLKAYPNIVIHYLPKPTFMRSMYELSTREKFYILELTQYHRVLYLDADVMLLCNLDYLFHLSERGMLKENIVMAGGNEPAVGHFMMLRPGKDEYKHLMEIVDENERHVLATENMTFDQTLGWGHEIQPPDRWRAPYDRSTGTSWDFPAAYANQGLVYHWTKYVKQSVSLFVGNEVENWSKSANSNGPVLESTLVDILKDHQCSTRLLQPQPPYDLRGQMWHFWDIKPWIQSNSIQTRLMQSDKVEHQPFQVWFHTLDKVTRRLNITLNVDKMLRRSPQWTSGNLGQEFQSSLERRFAYAYLIASCNPDHPQGYRGLLYGILVNAQILQNWGSTADIVLMVQMAHDSRLDTLPDEDVLKLKAYSRIVIRYLPKPRIAPTFYEVQFEKFRILDLFQYRRVLFMDADVMPLCNLDYLFNLSDAGFFKENMVVAGNNEPANGGFMMLRPGIGEYRHLRSIVETRDANILASSADLSFDPVLGWGHIIQPPDQWRTRYNRLTGTYWNFSAGYCDQGLVYHWVKYVKRSASLFAGNEVENWSSTNNSTDPVLEATFVDALKGHECPSGTLFARDAFAKPPYDMEGQFRHFGGKDAKPWMITNLAKVLNPNNTQYLDYQMWFEALDQVKSRLKIQVDLAKDLRQDYQMKHWTDKDDFKIVLERQHV